MKIGGLVKATLLDFPDRVAAVLFSQGCNFRCPYCHNPHLVEGRFSEIPWSRVMDFLHSRVRMLDGVVFSGGEPTIHDDLEEKIREVRKLGFDVKLDTNGSNPEVLRRLLENGLLDYVAIDLKSDVDGELFKEIIHGNSEAYHETVRIMSGANVPHEYRVTCAAPFVTLYNFEEMLNVFGASYRPKLFLQRVRHSESVLDYDFCSRFEWYNHAPSLQVLERIGKRRGFKIEVR